MQTQMHEFAEVILPLPLYSTFTYSIPDDLRGKLQTGSRVLVQFGRKKFYTGIVSGTTSQKPGDFEIKPIMALLDEAPIIRYPQLKFWQWISDYYLCSIGEVYKAAVPTGLKPESETWIALNPDYELGEGEKFSEKESLIVHLLDSEKKLRLGDIEEKLKIKKNSAIISRMLDRGILEIAEKLNQVYRPKTITVVELCAERTDKERLHLFFDMVKRARQQEKTLIAYLDLSKWMSSKDEVIQVSREKLLERSETSPAVLKAMVDKGIFRIVKKSVNRFASDSFRAANLSELSAEQTIALDSIIAIWQEKDVTLLHGVTGSGKTEIYTHLIQRCLKDGNQVLYLVPEISLTTQLTDRLRAVFGDRLIVYHSRFSDNERVDIWKKLLHTNEPYVIIGARSSLFLPFARLGLIIVDEEHEPSFKQYDPAPRYNARDAAMMLARLHGAKTLLGSATPSVETYYKATTDKYGLVELSKRYNDSRLPDVELIDMRRQRKMKENKGILSAPLNEELKKTLCTKQQAILFQNRRGFAPVVICKACGWSPKCVNCDVSMVYHKFTDSVHCHYCGHKSNVPALCPACGENTIETFGYGTERIAEEISEEFKEHSVSRMDLDTTRNKDSYQELISDFSQHKTDILVGTQMVTKGLDFGNVLTVGVLNADTILNFPDFRSNERAFNMLEQVAGRAGRREKKGKVLIQTSNIENEVLRFVVNHDYKGFYAEEIEERKRMNYPPFSKIIMIYLKNKDSRHVDEAAVLLAKALREVFGERVLGPEKPFISRIATYYLQQIMLKIEAGASMIKVKAILRKVYESLARDYRMKTTTVYYDVDPV